MGKIIDISMDLNERTVVCNGDAPPELRSVARIPAQTCNFTWLSFGSHAGTHVDAPFYLFPDGWASDEIPFDRLIGKCQVMDLTDVEDTISLEDIARHEIREQIILMKTRNSYDKMESYNQNHVVLSEGAAKYLIERGVKTLGYDYQSFEREGRNELHRLFLSKPVVIIDNLRLGHVVPGNYTLYCLPVKVTGIDGAPARAILVEEN